VKYVIIYTLINIRTKYTIHSNSPLFSVQFTLLLNVASAREWDFTAQQFWWSWVFAHLGGNIADDAMQMDVHKTLYPFYTTRKCPMLLWQSQENASLATIVRYINITTIYTVGYLEIFNAGHFYSRKHCHDLWRTKHWITMVFNETTNYNVNLLSKQGRTQLIYSTKLTTEHVFENFGGNCPVALPLIAGSACKTCQHHFTVVLKL